MSLSQPVVAARTWLRALAMSAGCVAAVAQAAAPVLAAPPPASSGAATSAVSPEYIIGPGDILEIFVWRNADLSQTLPVRPDGKITTRLVEDMVAVGKTPAKLAADIELALSEYVKSPQVNVIVTQAASAFSQIRVTGQVLHPQALAYRDGMTVMDAVLAVGGLAQFAGGNRAKVVRSEAGKLKEIKVRLGDLMNKGDMKQNVALKPGDVLVIPESVF
jgi:polysaccharide export outer membrane protein